MAFEVESIIVSIFRLINFAVIIGILWYIFKRYLLDSIRTEIHSRKMLFIDLKKKLRVLDRNYQILDKRMLQELQVQSELKEKLIRWRASVEQEQQALIHQKEARIKIVTERTKTQINQLQEYLLFKKLMPEVIEQARMQLAQQFDAHDRQEQYIKALVDTMEKS